MAEVREQLDRTLVEKQSIENDLASQLDSLTEQLAKLSVDKEESEKHLNNQIDDLHKSLIGQCQMCVLRSCKTDFR